MGQALKHLYRILEESEKIFKIQFTVYVSVADKIESLADQHNLIVTKSYSGRPYYNYVMNLSGTSDNLYGFMVDWVNWHNNSLGWPWTIDNQSKDFPEDLKIAFRRISIKRKLGKLGESKEDILTRRLSIEPGPTHFDHAHVRNDHPTLKLLSKHNIRVAPTLLFGHQVQGLYDITGTSRDMYLFYREYFVPRWFNKFIQTLPDPFQIQWRIWNIKDKLGKLSP